MAASEGSSDGAIVVGDFNAKDDEVDALVGRLDLREARYAGYSWGVKGNKFYADSAYMGPGLRFDRVLFCGKAWADAHLVGQGRRFFEGCEFSLSLSLFLSLHV